jgi:hypothetical protein
MASASDWRSRPSGSGVGAILNQGFGIVCHLRARWVIGAIQDPSYITYECRSRVTNFGSAGRSLAYVVDFTCYIQSSTGNMATPAFNKFLAGLTPPPADIPGVYDGWEFRWRSLVFRPACK